MISFDTIQSTFTTIDMIITCEWVWLCVLEQLKRVASNAVVTIQRYVRRFLALKVIANKKIELKLYDRLQVIYIIYSLTSIHLHHLFTHIIYSLTSIHSHIYSLTYLFTHIHSHLFTHIYSLTSIHSHHLSKSHVFTHTKITETRTSIPGEWWHIHIPSMC